MLDSLVWRVFNSNDARKSFFKYKVSYLCWCCYRTFLFYDCWYKSFHLNANKKTVPWFNSHLKRNFIFKSPFITIYTFHVQYTPISVSYNVNKPADVCIYLYFLFLFMIEFTADVKQKKTYLSLFHKVNIHEQYSKTKWTTPVHLKSPSQRKASFTERPFSSKIYF